MITTQSPGPMPTPDGDTASETTFKAQYLDSLRNLRTRADNLRRVVNDLFNYGISRKTLVEWGVEAGYRLSYMRSLISKLLCSKGSRSRNPGAGRKIPPEALALLACAREYGRLAPKFLLAAYRAAK